MKNIGRKVKNLGLIAGLGAILSGCDGKVLMKDYYCYGDLYDKFTQAVVVEYEKDYLNKKDNVLARRTIAFPEPQTSQELKNRFTGLYSRVYFDGLPSENLD